MSRYSDLLEVGRKEAANLKNLLASVEAESWTKRVGVSQWNVATTVAHMAWELAAYADSIERGLNGDVSPWAGFPPAASGAPSDIDKLIDARAQECRLEFEGALLAAYCERDDRLAGLLSGLDEMQRQQQCYHPLELLPAAQFIFLSIQEASIHGWDIGVSLNGGARLSEDAVDALMQNIDGRVRLRFARAARLTRPVVLRLCTTGVGATAFDVRMGAGAIQIEAADAAVPDVTIECDAEVLILWLFGRLPLQSAVASGKAVTRGNQAIAAALMA